MLRAAGSSPPLRKPLPLPLFGIDPPGGYFVKGGVSAGGDPALDDHYPNLLVYQPPYYPLG